MPKRRLHVSFPNHVIRSYGMVRVLPFTSFSRRPMVLCWQPKTKEVNAYNEIIEDQFTRARNLEGGDSTTDNHLDDTAEGSRRHEDCEQGRDGEFLRLNAASTALLAHVVGRTGDAENHDAASTCCGGGDLTLLRIAEATEDVYSPDASGDDADSVVKVDGCEVCLRVLLFQPIQKFLVTTRCGGREVWTHEILSHAVRFAFAYGKIGGAIPHVFAVMCVQGSNSGGDPLIFYGFRRFDDPIESDSDGLAEPSMVYIFAQGTPHSCWITLMISFC